MGIVRFALKFPYTFYVLAIFIVFLGVTAITVMPEDIFPEIDIPVVSVIWQYTGLSVPEMERKRDARTARGRSGGFGLSRDRGPVPGEQFVDAIDRVVGDAGDDVGEPSLGVDAVEASGPYERVHYGGSTAAFVGASEEVVLAPQGQRADGAFGGVVRHFEPAVVDEAGESCPARGRIANGAGERTLAADFGERRVEKGFEVGQDRR